jgi:hypothetical protein
VSLPQVNAQLLRVQGASSGDSAFDTGSEGAGPEKWAGQLEAYYQEKRDRVVSGEGITRVLVRSLIVATSSAPAIEVGDVVTFDSDAAGENLARLERRLGL